MDSDFSNYDTLIEYIKRLDEVRGTSFEQVYPELHKLLQNASK
jgi:hypothetical protein